MTQLTPDLILAAWERGHTSGHLHAVSLFADIAGFTALTEALMEHGKDGAQALTDVLAQVFAPLVAEVYARGGWITGFAGDAFTALFLYETDLHPAGRVALSAAAFIQNHVRTHAELATPFGVFRLGVRVGMGAGAVHWHILGPADQPMFAFRGPAIDGCAQAEQHARPGEVVAATDLAAWLPAPTEPLAPGWARLAPVDEADRLTALPAFPTASPGAAHLFLSPAVRAVVQQGIPAEFREVACVFLNFAEVDDTTLNGFVTQVSGLLREYDGYLKEVAFGDKGPMLVILFGAPHTHENDVARAADVLLALRQQIQFPWRAGLTLGRVYAGLVGGLERADYGALGDAMNLAARLMQSAPTGDIWVNAPVVERLRSKGYEFESAGTYLFKGKSEPQPVGRLVGFKTLLAETELYAGPLVGRETELAELKNALQPIFLAGETAGLVYIYGEAGMGKTRLLYELRQQLLNRRRGGVRGHVPLQWFYCPVDRVLRTSLNPFRYFLRSYFDQYEGSSEEGNRERFDDNLTVLLQALDDLGEATLHEELRRAAPFLAALLNLRYPHSPFEQLEPAQRFDLMLAAFATLIKAASLRQPVVIHLEDAQWLDSDSPELLNTLLRQTAIYPVAVLVTSRHLDNGGVFQLWLTVDTPVTTIELNPLTPEDVHTLSAYWLGGPPDAALAVFLMEKTRGNPFFVEQLALDLRARGVLALENVHWTANTAHMAQLPAGINAVLVARLDRLPTEVKSVVQMAAVLGAEFDVRVLERMASNDPAMTAKIQYAVAEAIWSPRTETVYAFRYTLLRDAAYAMQLPTRLHDLHVQVVRAIEDLCFDDPNPLKALAENAASLAHHARLAEQPDQERHFARLAGEHAMARFANDEASRHLNRALALTPTAQLLTRYELLSACELVDDLQAHRDSQRANLMRLEDVAQALAEPAYLAYVALRWANLGNSTANYTLAIFYAQKAIENAQAAASPHDEASGYLQWGRALWHLGHFEEGLRILDEALHRAQQAGVLKVHADALRLLGNIALDQGDYDRANAHYQKSLALCRELADWRGTGAVLINMGEVHRYQHRYREARSLYLEALQLARTMGFTHLDSLVLNNLGLVAVALGDYAAARDYNRQSIEVARLTGYPYSESWACLGAGLAHEHLGQHLEAQTFLERALNIAQNQHDAVVGTWAWLYLGLNALHQHEADMAEFCLKRALEGVDKTGNRVLSVHVQTVLGQWYLAQTLWAEAEHALQQALRLAHSLRQPLLRVEPLAGLAHAWLEMGDPAEAALAVTDVLDLLTQGHIEGTLHPLGVFGHLLAVLRALADPRLAEVQAQASAFVQARLHLLPAADQESYAALARRVGVG